jgi:hypothetical protein
VDKFQSKRHFEAYCTVKAVEKILQVDVSVYMVKKMLLRKSEFFDLDCYKLCDENTRKIASDKCNRTITQRTRGAHDKCMCSSRSERQA